MDWCLWVLIGFVIYNLLFLFVYLWKVSIIKNSSKPKPKPIVKGEKESEK